MRVWHRTERWTTDGFVIERDGYDDGDNLPYRVWQIDEGGHENHKGWYRTKEIALEAVERFAK